MKNRIFTMLMLAMSLALMGVSFVACGDDNDEPDPNPNPVPAHAAKIGIGYSLELGDGWWDFFDIEVTYTTAAGETETKTISKGWVYAASVDYDDAVSQYSFDATATPKATLPEINQETQYNFNKKAESYAFALNEKGEQVGVLAVKDNASTMTIAGSNVEKYLKVHTNLGAGTMELTK